MSQQIPTLTVVDRTRGVMVINACDFDPSRQVPYVDAAAGEAGTGAAAGETTASGPLPNGPTIEAYVAAGYYAENYPPQDYAEIPSPGLEEYRTHGTLNGAVPKTVPVRQDGDTVTVDPRTAEECVDDFLKTNEDERLALRDQLVAAGQEDTVVAIEQAVDAAAARLTPGKKKKR